MTINQKISFNVRAYLIYSVLFILLNIVFTNLDSYYLNNYEVFKLWFKRESIDIICASFLMLIIHTLFFISYKKIKLFNIGVLLVIILFRIAISQLGANGYEFLQILPNQIYALPDFIVTILLIEYKNPLQLSPFDFMLVLVPLYVILLGSFSFWLARKYFQERTKQNE
jgi:hypothetical protein